MWREWLVAKIEAILRNSEKCVIIIHKVASTFCDNDNIETKCMSLLTISLYTDKTSLAAPNSVANAAVVSKNIFPRSLFVRESTEGCDKFLRLAGTGMHKSIISWYA